VAFGLDAARNALARDPVAVDAALAQLKTEVQTSISDVRRLVYDLRPPALDQLGLVPAVQEYAARIDERGGPTVLIDASALPLLPAAVEVAAYRIATEALTNAARHSHATQAMVRFAFAEGQLRVEVCDDGVGIPSAGAARDPAGAGIGLAAMAERAAELGGTCLVAGNGTGGTSVVALLPVRAAS
jgi:signal transduction histidine kinase